MEKWQKRIFKANRRWFENEMMGELFSFPESGITIAICPHDPFGRFNKVAVAYCSPNDTFKKKMGFYAALEKLENNQFILMPAGYCSLQENANCMEACLRVG